jgi:hypothetical protein
VEEDGAAAALRFGEVVLLFVGLAGVKASNFTTVAAVRLGEVVLLLVNSGGVKASVFDGALWRSRSSLC